MKDVCLNGSFELKINGLKTYQVYPDYMSLVNSQLFLDQNQNKNQQANETVPNSKSIIINQFFSNIKANLEQKSFDEAVRQSLE